MALALKEVNFAPRQQDRPSFTCLLGNEPPTISDGYGGWQVVDRPRRTSMTFWAGRAPFKMRVPIVMNRYEAQDSIEDQIEKLEDMATGSRADPPPVIDLDGAGVPHNKTGWVIDSIEWGATERHHQKPHYRMRQEAVVNLIQFVAVDTLGIGRSRPSVKPRYRMYTVKKGDTLQKIAAKLLGNYKRWRDIAKLNDIRDPKHLKVGRRIRVPRR